MIRIFSKFAFLALVALISHAYGATSHAVGGTVGGLSGGVTLENNGGDDLRVVTNGAFRFATALAPGTRYSVTVRAQPTGQTCTATNSIGVVGATDITNVAIACVSTGPTGFMVSGTVNGLFSGQTVVVQNNAVDDQRVGNGERFSYGPFPPGYSYSVKFKAQPSFPAFNCEIDRGSGEITDHDVIAIVNCRALVPAVVRASVNMEIARSVSVQVIGTDEAVTALTITSGPPDFRPLVANASPGATYLFENLTNAQTYSFRLITEFENGASGASDVVTARPNVVSLNGVVNAVVVGPDGTQYVGGAFDRVGVTEGSAVPLNSAGRPAGHDFPIVAGKVNAIATDGSGGWYFGGRFTKVGNTFCTNLAHVQANGNVQALEANAPVQALLYSSGRVFVGGMFTRVAGATRSGLAAFNSADGTLRSWDPGAEDGSVLALAVSADGNTVYAGGDFTRVGPDEYPRLAAIDATTGANLIGRFLPGPNRNNGGSVNALAVSGNTLYVGGDFNTIAGVSRDNLSAISAVDGTLVGGFQPNPNLPVQALALSADGSKVYVGGYFNAIRLKPGKTVSPSFFTAVDVIDGTVSDGFDATAIGAPVLSLAVADSRVTGTAVCVGGGLFNRAPIGGRPDYIASFNGQTGARRTFSPGFDAEVNAIAVANGIIYAGGNFSVTEARIRTSLTALDVNGGLVDTDFLTIGGSVNALALIGNTLVVGGSFNSIGGVGSPNLGAVAVTTWLPLQRNQFFGGTDGRVDALAVSNGKLYVGGSFAHLANETRNNLGAVFTSDGTSVLDFNPNVNGAVHALAVQVDPIFNPASDKLYVGGHFDFIGGADRRNLALVPTDSRRPVDAVFQPNPNGEVVALGYRASGFPNVPSALYVAGTFNRIRTSGDAPGAATGVAGNLAAVFFSNGVSVKLPSSNLDFAPNLNNSVRALAVTSDRVYAGGYFTSVSGLNGSRSAGAWATDALGAPVSNLGELWLPKLDGPVFSLATSGNSVYIGGLFSTAGGIARSGFGAVDRLSGASNP